MSLFSADNLSINFGGIKAVDGVSFDVEQGEVFTIIGPNGAGKTTIFNLVSRIYEPSGGKLSFAGSDITNVPPHRIASLGIYGRWVKIRVFFSTFPMYRGATFKRQKSYMRSERLR